MPSKAYFRALSEAQAHHAGSKTYSGRFLRPHKPFLVDLIKRLDIASALDYGAGKGEQYAWVDPEDGKTLEEAFGFTVAKYDPAWPPFAAEPEGKFDLVMCTHVLGSIPTADLSWVLGRLVGRASKAVFIAEKIGTPKKRVFSKPEDHPIGWSIAEWLEKLEPMGRGADRYHGIAAHLSFRTRDDDEVQVKRYLWDDGWQVNPEFSS